MKERLLTPADRAPQVGDTLCWPTVAYNGLFPCGVRRRVRLIVPSPGGGPTRYEFSDRTLHEGSRFWDRVTYARRHDGGSILTTDHPRRARQS